jgi:HAD superfamily hydrolase (TIGR01484 family)
MGKIEIFYSDLDGTLVNQRKNELFSEVVETLRKIGPAYLGLATTRGYLRARQVGEGFFGLPWIVENGAAIYVPEGELLRSFVLSPAERTAVADVIIQNSQGIKLAAFYPKSQGHNMAQLYVRDHEKALQYQQNPHLKGVIGRITENPRDFAQWLVQLPTGMIEINPDELTKEAFPSGLNVTSDGNLYVTSEGVNKGTALSVVLNERGIDPKNVLVAGDSATDQLMFDIPGVTSIAVGNQGLRATYYVNGPRELSELLLRIIK